MVNEDDEVRFVSESVVINAPAEQLFDMLADVTRMGEWSEACTGAAWDEGAGPVAADGMWFTGHNVLGEWTYDAHCEIVAAERPTTIAWMQGGRDAGVAEWRYRIEPADDGAEATEMTKVTESWTLVRPIPPGSASPELIRKMPTAFEAGIRTTLAKFKAAAESSTS